MPSTRESCIQLLKRKKYDLEDPLDTLPPVWATFCLGVWFFERINNRICVRGLKGGPCFHQKLVWVVKNLKNKNKKKKMEKYKVRIGSR